MLWKLALLVGFVGVGIATHGFVGLVSKRQPGRHEAPGRAPRKPLFSQGALHAGARAGMLSVRQVVRQLNRERKVLELKAMALREAHMRAVIEQMWFAN